MPSPIVLLCILPEQSHSERFSSWTADAPISSFSDAIDGLFFSYASKKHKLFLQGFMHNDQRRLRLYFCGELDNTFINFLFCFTLQKVTFEFLWFMFFYSFIIYISSNDQVTLLVQLETHQDQNVLAVKKYI